MVSILILVFICQHVLEHLYLYEIKGTSLNCRKNKELKFVLLFLTHVKEKVERKL